MAPVALEIKHGIDQMFDDLWSRDLAFLGHMADEQHRDALALGEPDERLRSRAQLRHRAGRRFDDRRPQRLYGIDDHRRRKRLFVQGRDDIGDVRQRSEHHRRIDELQPFGAKLHLRDGLLPGNIDHPPASARQRRHGLKEKRGFADAGIASDERRRSLHEPAARYPVKLAHAGEETRRRRQLSLEPDQLSFAAFRQALSSRSRHRSERGLFDNRIPSPARVAPARPFGRRRSAALADVGS